MTQASAEPSELAERVALSCRILGKLNLTHGALGHVSMRLSDKTMLIKGKGADEVGLRYTSPGDVLEVDFEADKVAGPDGLSPPSESFIHIWLMKKNPDVNCVIHVHPRYAVLLTICEKEIFPIYGAFGGGAQLAVEGVPTYPRSLTVANHRLGEELADFMGTKKVALMRGHGVTVAGSSIEDATVRALALDQLVSMMYDAYLLGDPKPIPAEDLVEMKQRASETGPRPRGNAGGEVGMLAQFRYYKSLAGED